MHSSISSSDGARRRVRHERRGAPTSRRSISAETASDRPGVAQPVPKRPVPAQPWSRIFLGVLVMFALMLGGWEWYWRDFGATPGIRNSEGLWAIQRRRIDDGEGDATVMVGASRVYFDLQLDVWEKLDGKRPIQLAFEGTSPLPFLEDLAADPKFTGRVLVGIAPEVFFGGYALSRQGAEVLAQRIAVAACRPMAVDALVEPYRRVLRSGLRAAGRAQAPAVAGSSGRADAARRAQARVTEADRNTHMWSKVETDPEYRALTRRIWAQDFAPSPDDPTPAETGDKKRDEQIERAAKAVATLRARGVKVLFVRRAEQRPVPGIRQPAVSARDLLGCAAREDRRAGYTFRGLSGAAGTGAAGVVASGLRRCETLHRRAARDCRARFLETGSGERQRASHPE